MKLRSYDSDTSIHSKCILHAIDTGQHDYSQSSTFFRPTPLEHVLPQRRPSGSPAGPPGPWRVPR